MSTVKQYGQSGIGSSVEIGKGGPRFKNDSGDVAFRDNTDGSFVSVKGADPTHDDHFVTKRFLERQARVVVISQIDGSAPGTPSDGEIGIVTSAGGDYALKELYRGEDGTWVQIAIFEGMTIRVSDDLAGGTDTYSGDRIYIWDADTSTWGDIGPTTSVAGVVKVERATLSHDTGSPLSIGSALPSNAKSMMLIVNVTQSFNGSTPTLEIGDAIDPDRLMTVDEIDLTTVGIYVAPCPYLFGSETQVIATYVADGSSVGTASIDLQYSLV